MYFFVEGQNDFWHVTQTCPDRTNTTVRAVSFFGVDLLLGTCVHGIETPLGNIFGTSHQG